MRLIEGMNMKHTVVVTNRSGRRIHLHGMVIKSLRETLEDQPFSFDTDSKATKFEHAVTNLQITGLTALYAGGETLNTTSTETKTDYQSLSVKELKAECKVRNITGYSSLNEGELIALLEADDAESKEK